MTTPDRGRQPPAGSRNPNPETNIHRAAASGYQRQSQAYRRGRPAYHPALAERIAARYGPDPDRRTTLVELGAGTGIFTAQMAGNGLAVTAVEPVAAMRDAIISSLPAELRPLVSVVGGTAERTALADDSVHTVVASQSFHWFDHRPALDEIARVLTIDGHLVTVWNVRDNRVDWVRACTDVVDRYAGDTPRHRTMGWRHAIEADARFALVEDQRVDNPAPTTPAGVIDRTLSTSFIGALDEAEQAEVVAEIRAITEPLGTEFDYPYTSELQAWRYLGDGRSGQPER
ncbi:MAG: class I SAM-dependent methyltransferase [Acidimicrobiales bacterium]